MQTSNSPQNENSAYKILFENANHPPFLSIKYLSVQIYLMFMFQNITEKNTPGTRVVPGFQNHTLAVKNREKTPENQL